MKSVLWLVAVFIVIVAGYYFYPVDKIPAGVVIDKLVVLKSAHKLQAYSQGKLIVSYPVAIGQNPVGKKQFEGDKRTPEGQYKIIAKNAQSGYHKNLGISYPNEDDIANAKRLGKPTGGDVKIHGLKNGRGYIGKFQRWTDWTAGCIALTDEELDELYAHTPVNTPIDIRP